MTYLLNAIFIVLLVSTTAFSQCVPASLTENTSAPVCTGCNTAIASGTTASVTMNTAGNTWCVPAGQTSTITTLNWTQGILNVCGNLTIGNIVTGSGFPPSTGSPALIYVGTGGSLTITAFNSTTSSLITGCGIANRGGTLVFTGDVAVNGSDAWIITANVSSITTFNGTFKVSNSDNFMSRGTTIFNSTVNLNTNAGFCFEKSYTEFNAAFTNGGYMYYNGTTAATDALITYNSTLAFGGSGMVNSVAANSNIKFCKNTSGTSYTANFCTANGGSGGACPVASLGVYASYSNSACANPLPVIFKNFVAQKISSGVQVLWTTSQEFNNDHFELERSYDGITFEKITDVKGQGTKSSATSYLFVDAVAIPEIPVYYRLKQVDFDGDFVYSSVIVLNGSAEKYSIVIFPNPLEIGTVLYARFGEGDDGTAKVALFDLSGKIIHDYVLDNINSGGIYAIEDKNLLLTEGSYILQIRTAQHVYNQKFEVR